MEEERRDGRAREGGREGGRLRDIQWHIENRTGFANQFCSTLL